MHAKGVGDLEIWDVVPNMKAADMRGDTSYSKRIVFLDGDEEDEAEVADDFGSSDEEISDTVSDSEDVLSSPTSTMKSGISGYGGGGY